MTSPDLSEVLDGLGASDPVDLPALELEADVETEGVKNEDVGEPALAVRSGAADAPGRYSVTVKPVRMPIL